MRTVGRLTGAFLLLIGTSGCGTKYYPVSGEVVFSDGTPLRGGMVFFHPADAHIKTSAQGEIQSDGTFQLTTAVKGDGVPEGRYRVTVTPPLPLKREGKGPPPPQIDPRYANPDTSRLEFAVTRDRSSNHFRIEVDRPEQSGN
jgi:hypothetical protein